MLHIVQVRHVSEHTLWVRFNDGTEGEVDLAEELWGEVFEPLRDVDLFKQVAIDPTFETVTWPNGADMAPEFLFQRLRVRV
jgi:hypothetical protein